MTADYRRPPRSTRALKGVTHDVTLGRYELEVQQQPRLAYLSEANTKSGKRPLDPPPIVRLRSRPSRRSRLDSIDDSSSEEDFDFDWSNLSQITHRLFLFAALVPEEAAEDETYAARNDLVTGTVFSSLSYLRGQNCFAFPDLNILAEGRWRLCMSLFELTRSGVRFQTSTLTEPFEVFAQERFPLLTTTCETFQKIVAKEAQKNAEELAHKSAKDAPAGPKKPRKPRAPSTSSLAERTVRPSHTSLTHIPYQRKPRPRGPSYQQGGAQDLPTGAGNFKRYPRLQPDRIFEPESLDNTVARTSELPSRRIVSAAAVPSQSLAPPRERDNPYPPAQPSHLQSPPAPYDSRLASVHNPTVPRPPVPTSSILPPIHASRSYPSVLQARPRRAVSASQAIGTTSPSRASAMTTSLSTPGATTSPTPSFADLLAAAAVVEQRESGQAERGVFLMAASCVCQPQAPDNCAMQVDSPAKRADPTAEKCIALSPPPTSRSLSRLLGEVKDAKLFEGDHAGTPMFF